jgi:hypothetical protein
MLVIFLGGTSELGKDSAAFGHKKDENRRAAENHPHGMVAELK